MALCSTLHIPYQTLRILHLAVQFSHALPFEVLSEISQSLIFSTFAFLVFLREIDRPFYLYLALAPKYQKGQDYQHKCFFVQLLTPKFPFRSSATSLLQHPNHKRYRLLFNQPLVDQNGDHLHYHCLQRQRYSLQHTIFTLGLKAHLQMRYSLY